MSNVAPILKHANLMRKTINILTSAINIVNNAPSIILINNL